MKISKICPKCKGMKLVRFDGHTGAYGVGNNVMTGSTIFSAVNVNRYVCSGCGYSEEWIDQEDLKRIMESKNGKHL